MKQIYKTIRGYFLPFWIFATLTAGIDTLYGIFGGSIFADNVPSFISLFSTNVIPNFFLLVIVASISVLGYYCIVLLFKKFRKRDNFRAFLYFPAFIILPISLFSVILNEKYLSYFFSLGSLIANGILLLVAIILIIGSLFFLKSVFKRFDNKKLATLGYIYSIIVSIVYIIGLIFSLPETQNREEIIDNAPNVIVITIDALRQDRISIYSEEFVETPNIDNFADDSVVFENGYTHAPWTVPSMYTMHTSRYPSVHGSRIFEKGNNNIPMLAETLNERGYRTEAFIANPILNTDLGFGRGFDKYVEYGDIESIDFLKKATLYRLLKRVRDTALPHIGIQGEDSTKWITNRTVKSLSTMKNEPLFLWVHYMDPHTPLIPPREYIEGDDNYKDELLRFGRLAVADDHLLKKEDSDKIITLYDAEVRYVDDQLEKVFESLSDYGYLDNSIIIITADHGEEHFEHGYYGHSRTHFTEVMSIPFIVYIPDSKHGRCNYPVGLIDLKPTILDYVGIEPSPDLSGESLVEYLYDVNKSSETRFIYFDQTSINLFLKSTIMSDFTLIRDGDTDYSYTMIDSTKISPDDVVEMPDSELFKVYQNALDKWVLETKIEKGLLGENSETIEIDEERKNKLKALGYL